MTFDTSLFAANDPELAKQVAELPVYFEGMETVKISWIDAKALVKEASSYKKEIEAFISMLSHGKNNVPYYYVLERMAIEKQDFRYFMKIIKYCNNFYYGKGYDSVRVVYYATVDVM